MRTFTDQEVITNAHQAVANERAALLEVLESFIAIEARGLFAHNHSSMFEFATRELKLSEGQAQRRLDGARTLKRHPGIREKIRDGRLNLAHLTIARKYFRQEKKLGRALTQENEAKLLSELEGASTREAEKKICARTGEEELTKIVFKVDAEQLATLNRLREVWSHRLPDGEWTDVLVAAAELALEKEDPLRKAERVVRRKSVPATANSEGEFERLETGEVQKCFKIKEERRPKASVRHQVMLRDGGECGFTYPNGEKCRSRHRIEIDHAQPFALGGSSDLANLRLRCAKHNAHHAREVFGWEYLKRRQLACGLNDPGRTTNRQKKLDSQSEHGNVLELS